MFYELLGRLVWSAGKRYVRRRYGTAMAPKAALAGGLVAVAVGVVLFARRNGSH